MGATRLARSFVLGAVLAGGAGTVAWRGPAPPVPQPIAFNHALHVEGGISCERCHPGAKEGIRAGLPAMGVCLECHEEALSEKAEEAKVRAYLDRRSENPWVPLSAIETSNVFFSHRRHTRVAGIACERCHGAVEKAAVPPERPLHEWRMGLCLECHRRDGVSQDCLACHR